MKIVKKILFFCIFVVFCIGGTYMIGYVCPKLQMLESNQISIYDRNDNLVMNVHCGSEGEYVSLEEINDYFIFGFIASEDENFYKHYGFSLKGLTRALINNINNGTVQGGSTITQQLARSLYLDNEKSISRKLKEAFLTIRIETHYDKDKIIEQYLNNIYLGHNIYGIESASMYYFSKSNKKLSLDEVAMIVGIANAPNLNAPDISFKNAINRRNYVLGRMLDLKYISDDEYQKSITAPTNINVSNKEFLNSSTPYYFYIYNKLIEEGLYTKKNLAKGLKVYTTIDKDIQRDLIKIVSENNYNDNNQIAAVIMKANSSDVLAMCGGYDLNDQYNRAIYSYRAIGSTIKPLLYYLALKCGMEPDTFLNCCKKDFNIVGYETYSPTNASNTYASKPINMIEAIGLSDNIYATKTLLYVGFERFNELLRQFNFESNCVPSSGLGVDETTLLNLTSIYNCFASLGTYYKPRIIKEIVDNSGVTLYKQPMKSQRKLSKPYVFILNQMLRSPFDERLIDYSKPTLLNYKTENIFAAKTGSDKSNSYTIGFNPLYTIGVWSGTDDNQLFTKSHISKKVFQSVANSLEFDSLWYNPPSYILKKKINPITAKEIKNGSEYWFFKDY